MKDTAAQEEQIVHSQEMKHYQSAEVDPQLLTVMTQLTQTNVLDLKILKQETTAVVETTAVRDLLLKVVETTAVVETMVVMDNNHKIAIKSQ